MNKILFILCILAISINANAKDTIRIGIKNSPPFIIKNGDSYTGISISLWDGIAQKLNLEYSFVEYPGLKELISDVEKRKVDLCIAPLTVTSERIKNLSFSLPIYVSNIAIATKVEKKSSVFQFIRQLFSIEFMRAIGLLFLVVFCFGFILWLFERNKNPEQFRDGIRGIWDGIWWSAVTMTTVGYGDKSPVSIIGRIIALIWMFTAVIVISSFTASIASSLTVDQMQNKINNLNDLNKYNLGTVEKSSTNEKLTKLQLKHSLYPNVDELINAVKDNSIDFAIFDEPILKYKIHEHELEGKLHVFSPSEIIQYYSFSAPKNSDLLEKLNPHIISFIESSEWDKILNDNHILK